MISETLLKLTLEDGRSVLIFSGLILTAVEDGGPTEIRMALCDSDIDDVVRVKETPEEIWKQYRQITGTKAPDLPAQD